MTAEQHVAVALLVLYGISAHALARSEAAPLADQVLNEVLNDPVVSPMDVTPALLFDRYDRALHLKRTGPVQP